MDINKKIENYFKNNNTITTSEFVKLGFSRTLLGIYVKNNLMIKVKHGVYSLNDVIDDMYILSINNNIIFSHESAAFLNGISDRTPFIHTITLKSSIRPSKNLKEETKYYYIKDELYEIGLIEIKTNFGNIVKCYNKERVICDILRSKNRIDDESFITILKNYSMCKDKNLILLNEYSILFNVSNKLKIYMGVLL